MMYIYIYGYGYGYVYVDVDVDEDVDVDVFIDRDIDRYVWYVTIPIRNQKRSEHLSKIFDSFGILSYITMCGNPIRIFFVCGDDL